MIGRGRWLRPGEYLWVAAAYGLVSVLDGQSTRLTAASAAAVVAWLVGAAAQHWLAKRGGPAGGDDVSG